MPGVMASACVHALFRKIRRDKPPKEQQSPKCIEKAGIETDDIYVSDMSLAGSSVAGDDDSPRGSVRGPLSPPTYCGGHRLQRRRHLAVHGAPLVMMEDEVPVCASDDEDGSMAPSSRSAVAATHRMTRLASVDSTLDTFSDCLQDGASEVRRRLSELSSQKAMHLVNQRLSSSSDLAWSAAAVPVDMSEVYDHLTPLAFAIMRDDDELLEELLRHGADVHQRPCVLRVSASAHLRDLPSPLHLAALRACRPRTLSLLISYGGGLQQRPEPASLADLPGATSREVSSLLLYYIASCTDTDTCLQILGLFGDEKESLHDGGDLCYVLHLAVKNDNAPLVRLMLARGMAVNRRCPLGKTPLLLACGSFNRGGSHLVEMLVNAGADIHLPDAFRRTPLHFALKYCSTETVSLLLQAGANVFAEDLKGRTCYQYIFNNNTSKKVLKRTTHEKAGALVELLVNSVENFRVPLFDDFLQGALALSRDSSDEHLLTFVRNHSEHCEHGDVDELLLSAISHGRIRTVSWMLEQAHCSVSARDASGYPALQLSLLDGEGDTAMFHLLRQCGASLEDRSEDGLTALWVMIRLGLEELAVQSVVKDGADVFSTAKLVSVYRLPVAHPPFPRSLYDPDTMTTTLVAARRMHRLLTTLQFSRAMGLTTLCELLISRGVHDEQGGGKQPTVAATDGHTSHIQTSGADTNGRISHIQTAGADTNGRISHIQTAGADTNGHTSCKQTAGADTNGQISHIQTAGADINTQISHTQTAVADANGHISHTQPDMVDANGHISHQQPSGAATIMHISQIYINA